VKIYPVTFESVKLIRHSTKIKQLTNLKICSRWNFI